MHVISLYALCVHHFIVSDLCIVLLCNALQASFHGTCFCMHHFTTSAFACIIEWHVLCVHHLCVSTFKVCFVYIFLHCVLYICHFTACACCVLLQNTAETLRRQVKEEIHTRTVLQARINSDTQEIEKTRSESAKKKEKVQETILCLS